MVNMSNRELNTRLLSVANRARGDAYLRFETLLTDESFQLYLIALNTWHNARNANAQR